MASAPSSVSASLVPSTGKSFPSISLPSVSARAKYLTATALLGATTIGLGYANRCFGSAPVCTDTPVFFGKSIHTSCTTPAPSPCENTIKSFLAGVVAHKAAIAAGALTIGAATQAGRFVNFARNHNPFAFSQPNKAPALVALDAALEAEMNGGHFGSMPFDAAIESAVLPRNEIVMDLPEMDEGPLGEIFPLNKGLHLNLAPEMKALIASGGLKLDFVMQPQPGSPLQVPRFLKIAIARNGQVSTYAIDIFAQAKVGFRDLIALFGQEGSEQIKLLAADKLAESANKNGISLDSVGR